MTRHQVVRAVAARLGSAAEARWLVEHVGTGPGAEDRLAVLVDRRLAGEPLQYLLGTWPFRSLDLAVDPRALIPRPETEQVAEVALGELHRLAGDRPDPVVVDLGTGTGAIALSMAVERPGARVWATDADDGALQLAAANRERVGVAVALRSGSWFDALPGVLRGRIDVVVSNPPYVSEGEWAGLDPEVRREPHGALVAGPGSDGTPGLAGVEAVLRGSFGWLARPGAVVVELAPHQAGAAAALAEGVGFRSVRVAGDLSGRDRAVVGRT